MKNILRSILVCVVAQALTGCSLIPHTEEFASNYKSAYLHSKNGQNLVIPKPLSDANLSDFYQLPNQSASVLVISIKPPMIRASE